MDSREYFLQNLDTAYLSVDKYKTLQSKDKITVADLSALVSEEFNHGQKLCSAIIREYHRQITKAVVRGQAVDLDGLVTITTEIKPAHLEWDKKEGTFYKISGKKGLIAEFKKPLHDKVETKEPSRVLADHHDRITLPILETD